MNSGLRFRNRENLNGNSKNWKIMQRVKKCLLELEFCCQLMAVIIKIKISNTLTTITVFFQFYFIKTFTFVYLLV